MQQQMHQQLQRMNQMCMQAASLSQQLAHEIQQFQQSFASTSYGNQTGYGATGSYPSSFSGSGLGGGQDSYSQIMNADRQNMQEENTPSYRNYNMQTPSYSPSQSMNYTSQVNSNAMQSVMNADRQANSMGASSYPQGNGLSGGMGYQNSYGGQMDASYQNVSSIMQADRQASMM